MRQTLRLKRVVKNLNRLRSKTIRMTRKERTEEWTQYFIPPADASRDFIN